MFDYISGKTRGSEAELEAMLEHVMAHCVPASALDKLREENAKLRAALEELIDGARGLSDLALQRVADKWEAYLANE